MHHRMDTILKRLRQDVARHIGPDSVLAACKEARHTWRDCALNPVAVFHLFVAQVVRGNTSITGVAALAGKRFTPEAYCLARARLPLAVFQSVLRKLVDALAPDAGDGGRWRGHRTFLVDGSGFSMPDEPGLRRAFGQPAGQAPGCGFPVAKMLAMFHAATGTLTKVFLMPLDSHDIAAAAGVRRELSAGDLLVGDRAFCSFAHLAMLANGGIHAVFRMHQRQIVDFTPGRPHARPGAAKGLPRSRWVRGLGPLDQVVEWPKPAGRPCWMSAERYAALPGSLAVRELRYRLGRPGFRTREVTLATTLLDAGAYPLEALAELYGTRWRVELNLRHLKTTLKMDVLKCKTLEGVLKELTVYAVVYNLVRLVMCEAASRQGVSVERVSFVDALRWLEHARPGDDLPDLVVNPDRPGRFEPRVRKRRPKQYPLMTKPRSVLRERLLQQEVAA
jgi:Transposase DDE domain